MTDRLRGLIRALRRGSLDWSSFDLARIRGAFLMPGGSGVAPEVTGISEEEAEHSQEDVEASSSYPPPSDRLARQLARRSSFRISRSVGKIASGLPPIPILDSDDEGAPGGRGSPAVMQPPRSKRELKGWKLVLEGDGPLSMDQGDLVSLARCTRSMDCRHPSLASLDEEGACAKVVVASSKVMEAFNVFAVTMEDRVHTLRNESEVEKGKVEVRRLKEELRTDKEEAMKKTRRRWTRVVELEADRDQDIRRGSRAARREVANAFQEVLTSLEKRWVDKKKEDDFWQVVKEEKLQEGDFEVESLMSF
ncbi:hypothetical protein F2Q70_00038502 [Brassica cretica]|uniref:Uncharacterized protein n=1 Tax=Brassica cretica TaxID=69181 RepID=A0A8S9KEL6_BRACR|nr:hypothetical protein F2Q70_00038502 [Brassica cretica]